MLTQIKCQNCGANVKIDENNKKFICEYCGSENVLEDTINNVSTVNEYHTTQNIVKNIYNNDIADVSDIISKADVFVTLGEFEKAEKMYLQAIDMKPKDYRSWFGIVKVRTKNFSNLEDKSHLDFLEKAKKVADEEQKVAIEKEYEEYILKIEQEKTRQKLEGKQRKIKKLVGILSVVLVLIIGISIFIPIYKQILAEKEADLIVRDGLILEQKEDYYIVTGIEKIFDEHIVIPNEYKGKPIKEIAPYAFSSEHKYDGNKDISSVVISDNITIIEEAAFFYCPNLTRVELGKNVKVIGASAFSGCHSLGNIYIPESVTSIGSYAFNNCYLNLKEILIPDSVNEMGSGIFDGCESLKVICCAMESQPNSWADDWNSYNKYNGYLHDSHNVIWGYKG